MTRRQTELDRITTLMSQCLGRIDEQAYRLQDPGSEDFEACDVLETEAALLQELVGSMVMHAEGGEKADLNRIVEQGLRNCIAELGIPVVIRQKLGAGLPQVAFAPGQLGFAVQRALLLTLGAIEAGGEISVVTRMDQEAVLLEIESGTLNNDAHLGDRAATLSEFVTGLGGTCRVDTHGHSCLIAMELPATLVAGR